MSGKLQKTLVAALASATLAGCAGMMPGAAGPQNMTFFVTSKGPGKGADLGGLSGADAHCAALAKAAGAPADRVWRAYLSTQAPALNDPNFVNARDRIGKGPWQNAKGEVIATGVDELHSPASRLTKATAVDETGGMVKGRTEKPNTHDMLTGSRPDGTAFPGAPFGDMTCGNWTRGGKEGSAMVGHHDLVGPIETATWAKSWNSAHPSRGCDPEGLASTGGAGLYYCFAAK